MALKDLVGLIDNKLKDVFASKPYDPTAARKPVLKAIERTEEQFGAVPPSKAPNKWWKAANNVVEFSPKVGGSPLLINGEATNYIPSERFPDFLKAFRQAVEAGDFDKEIEAGGKGSAKVSVPGGSGRARKSSLPPRADGLEHRVPAGSGQPHPSFTLNKAGTYWRSPEQVEADDKQSKQRLASIAKNK